MAGTYMPETQEFAKQLRNHKDLSFCIENIKEIKLYADAAVSVGTLRLPPCELVKITLGLDWTDANLKGNAQTSVSYMQFIVVSPAYFAGALPQLLGLWL
jgi:hypothetical protein